LLFFPWAPGFHNVISFPNESPRRVFLFSCSVLPFTGGLFPPTSFFWTSSCLSKDVTPKGPFKVPKGFMRLSGFFPSHFFHAFHSVPFWTHFCFPSSGLEVMLLNPITTCLLSLCVPAGSKSSFFETSSWSEGLPQEGSISGATHQPSWEDSVRFNFFFSTSSSP